MCGIFGVIGKRLSYYDKSIFNSLSILNEQRGGQAYGISDLKKVYRRPQSILNVTAKYNNVIKKASKVLLGHTRQATHGKNTDNNCHPFLVDGVTLAHNGVIYNVDELEKITGVKYEVDSQYLALLISQARNKKDLEKKLNKCKGYYAVWFYNDKKDKIYFLCNDQRLSYFKTDKKFIFSSDAEHIKRACLGNVAVKMFKEKYLYTLDIKSLKLSKTKLKNLKDNYGGFEFRSITNSDYNYACYSDYKNYEIKGSEQELCAFCLGANKVKYVASERCYLCEKCAKELVEQGLLSVDEIFDVEVF